MPPPTTDGGLTTNYELVRIAGTDFVNINDDFNYNWNQLDQILFDIQTQLDLGTPASPFALSGDLSGTLPTGPSTVTGLGGIPIAISVPADQDTWIYDAGLNRWTVGPMTGGGGGGGPLIGDVNGAIGANTVTAIQNIPVSTTDPITGDALVFDGTEWLPTAGGGTGTDAEAIHRSVATAVTAQTTIFGTAFSPVWSLRRTETTGGLGAFDILGTISWGGSRATGNIASDAAHINVTATDDWSTNYQGTQMTFANTLDTSTRTSQQGISVSYSALSEYRIGTRVLYQFNVYQKIMEAWLVGKIYPVGFKVTYQGAIYECINDNAIGTDPATAVFSWRQRGIDDVPDNSPLTWRLIGPYTATTNRLQIRPGGGLYAGDITAAAARYSGATWSFVQPGAHGDWFGVSPGGGFFHLNSTGGPTALDAAASSPSALVPGGLYGTGGYVGATFHTIMEPGSTGVSNELAGLFCTINNHDNTGTGNNATGFQCQSWGFRVAPTVTVFAGNTMAFIEASAANRYRWRSNENYFINDDVTYGTTVYRATKDNGPGFGDTGLGNAATNAPNNGDNANIPARHALSPTGRTNDFTHTYTMPGTCWEHIGYQAITAMEADIGQRMPLLRLQDDINETFDGNGFRIGGTTNYYFRNNGVNDIDAAIRIESDHDNTGTYIDGIVSSTNAKSKIGWNTEGGFGKGSASTPGGGWSLGRVVWVGDDAHTEDNTQDNCNIWNSTDDYFGSLAHNGTNVFYDTLYDTPNWDANNNGVVDTTYVLDETARSQNAPGHGSQDSVWRLYKRGATYDSGTGQGWKLGDEPTNRYDTPNATTTIGSNVVLDNKITALDQGRGLAGTGMPAASFVGTVTPGVSFLISNSRTAQSGSLVTTAQITANVDSITLQPRTGAWTALGPNINKSIPNTDFWTNIGTVSSLNNKFYRLYNEPSPISVNLMTWTAGSPYGTVTVTTGGAHGLSVGQTIEIGSVVPQEWNTVNNNRFYQSSTLPKVTSVLNRIQFTTTYFGYENDPGAFAGPLTKHGNVRRVNTLGDHVVYSNPPGMGAEWAEFNPVTPWHVGVRRYFLWLGPTEHSAGSANTDIPAPLFSVDAKGNLKAKSIKSASGVTGGGSINVVSQILNPLDSPNAQIFHTVGGDTADIVELSVTGNTGTVNLNDPVASGTISDGTDGQRLLIVNEGSGGVIKFYDFSVEPNSNLVLTGTSTVRILNPGDIVEFVFVKTNNTATTRWHESFSNVTGSASYKQYFGDGSAETFVITHALGTKDVIVAVYDPINNVELFPEVIRSGLNQVTLNFSGPPPASPNQYRILVKEV